MEPRAEATVTLDATRLNRLVKILEFHLRHNTSSRAEYSSDRNGVMDLLAIFRTAQDHLRT